MSNPAPTGYARLACPVGELLLAARDGALIGVWFTGRPHCPEPREDRYRPAVLAEAAGQLQAYFAGQRTCFDLPLHPGGSPFQQRVWAALGRIPFGSTASYRQVAAEVGSPGAVRAVGLAIGRNPLSVIVPCHRVIGSDGRLTGYAGGLPAKRWLLDHEAGGDGPAPGLF